MIGKMFFSLLSAFGFVAYFIWVFLSTNGMERIERACTPVEWTSDIVTPFVNLLVPTLEEDFENGFKKATYSCQYTLWSFAYKEEYEKKLEEEAAKKAINNQGLQELGFIDTP